MGPVRHCGHLVKEEGAVCFDLHWLIACVLYDVVYLLFLLASLIGYVLLLWLFLDIARPVEKSTFEERPIITL